MHLQENTLFDLDLVVKVAQNVTQYPLHHVIYASTKFEIATSNGLGEDTITRNVTDGRTDARTDRRTTDRLLYEINIHYFSNEKAGIINVQCGLTLVLGGSGGMLRQKNDKNGAIWCILSFPKYVIIYLK